MQTADGNQVMGPDILQIPRIKIRADSVYLKVEDGIPEIDDSGKLKKFLAAFILGVCTNDSYGMFLREIKSYDAYECIAEYCARELEGNADDAEIMLDAVCAVVDDVYCAVIDDEKHLLFSMERIYSIINNADDITPEHTDAFWSADTSALQDDCGRRITAQIKSRLRNGHYRDMLIDAFRESDDFEEFGIRIKGGRDSNRNDGFAACINNMIHTCMKSEMAILKNHLKQMITGG